MTIKDNKSDFYGSSSEAFALVAAFENCTLPPTEWTREAFLTVIFWHLFMNPLPEAARAIRLGVRRYNFEHNIGRMHSQNYETSIKFWTRKVNECLKRERSGKVFVVSLNRTLRQLAGEEASKIGKRIYKPENAKKFGARHSPVFVFL